MLYGVRDGISATVKKQKKSNLGGTKLETTLHICTYNR